MPTLLRDVRFQGQSGKHVLALSFSGFDPQETSRAQNLRHAFIPSNSPFEFYVQLPDGKLPLGTAMRV
jgi:hypothetical protein